MTNISFTVLTVSHTSPDCFIFKQRMKQHSFKDYLLQAFLLAIFSKLKGGKTQRFSKLKQFFCKTQGKYLKTQFFGNFCRYGLFLNTVNEVKMRSFSQFYCITLSVLPLLLSLSILWVRNSTETQLFSKTQDISLENSRKFQLKTQ